MVLYVNFEMDKKEMCMLEERIWKILEKYRCGMPYPSTVPLYLIELQYNIEPELTNAVWVKFIVEWQNNKLVKNILNEESKLIDEIKSILEEHFGNSVFLHDVQAWVVFPL